MKNMSSDAKKCLIASIVVVVLLVVGFIIFYVNTTNKIKAEANQVNQELSDRINGATRTVYRALTDIAQGQIITADLVQVESNALSDTAQSLLFDSSDLGKQATVSITAGEDLHKSMVGDALEEEWQEVELDCVWLSSNLKQYDYVDIRILYPNGTDYIVISKKCLQSVKLSVNNIFAWFTEDEILNIDAAIVDANLYGAKIYTTKYVDSALESANEVTYQPSDAIIDLMNSDPNVLAEAKENLSKQARADMESKLEEFKVYYSELGDTDDELGYDFDLDTSTNAGTGSSDNNNGTGDESDDTSYDSESSAAIDSGANSSTGGE